MHNQAKIWNRFAKGYAKRPVADQQTYEKKLEVTRGYLRPDMEMLEFGCGTGSTALIHAPYVKHILAIDISSKMIEIAQGKADAAGVENITFKQQTIDELEVPDGIYDAVLGLSILHLLKNKEEAIAKVYRALKPGGIFVSSTGCLGENMSIFQIILPAGYFLGLLPLVQFFTAKELTDSLTSAGFEIDHHWQPGKGKIKSVFIVAKKPV